MAKSPIKPKNSITSPKIKPNKSVDSPIIGFPTREEELLYYGFHACQALFKTRKQDIIKVYCTEERVQDLGVLLKWCATNKKAYHVVPKDDIARVTASVHHEGIAVLAKRKKPLTEKELFERLKNQRQPLIVMDSVLNPHNVGAIMRVMAHFGWKYLICAEKDGIRLSSSAARLSEGGCEQVEFTFYKDTQSFLSNLKALGYQTIGTSSHAPKSLYKTNIKYPEVAFFLGNEVTGLSPFVASKLDISIKIPSSGSLQSLNVATASALFIGECVRKHGINS